MLGISAKYAAECLLTHNAGPRTLSGQEKTAIFGKGEYLSDYTCFTAKFSVAFWMGIKHPRNSRKSIYF